MPAMPAAAGGGAGGPQQIPLCFSLLACLLHYQLLCTVSTPVQAPSLGASSPLLVLSASQPAPGLHKPWIAPAVACRL